MNMKDRPKIKILHLLWTGHSGGMEKFVYDITRFADRSRFEHQVCFLAQGGWVADQIQKNATEVKYCLMKSGGSFFKSLNLFKIINDFQPQIIMNHQRNLLSNLYLSFFFYNKVKIYYEHGGNLLSQGSKVTRLFYKLFSWQYRMILTNSNLVKQKIQALKIPDEDKVNVLYLGIDVDKYRKKERNEGFYAKLGLDQKKKIIGAVGRMVEQKGWDDFLSVANEIQLLDQNYQFLIIGDGPLRSELEAKSKEMSLSVMFLGNREDVQDLLQIFDLFMMTSKWEPFGLTVLEALAAEVPVVGYYVDGMGEIFDHGGGGVLLKERNPQKLAQTVIDIFAEEGRLRTFSQEGKKNVECNFDIKTTIRNLEKYYLQLVQ